MTSRLRWKLTLLFTSLMLAVYAADAVFAYWYTDEQLTLTIQDDLVRMCDELLPDIDYHDGRPNLHNWDGIDAGHRFFVGTGVQLFDSKKHLLTAYGQTRGIEPVDGRIDGGGKTSSAVYSHYLALPQGGYLQIQMSARQHDQFLMRFVLSKAVRLVLMAIIIGICGWYFCGKVLVPVVRSLKVLRTFIDDAGHELKTPVTVIESSIETVESFLSDNNLPTGALRKLERASARLKGLATNMILLARMEQPAITLTMADVDLSETATGVECELADLATKCGVTLKVNVQRDAKFKADKEAITILLSNLVRNAIQYTQRGGTVIVSGGKADERHVFITVEDNGRGIAEDSLPLIFDRFFRVDKSRSADTGGSGLGLAIVKAIVQSHGGSIKVDSELGRGSLFRVVLPTQQSSYLLSLNMDVLSRK